MKRNDNENVDKSSSKKVENCSTNKGRQNRRNRNKSTNRSHKKSDDLKQLSTTRGDDINDSSYYYSDPLLLEQMTNYSFNQFAGVPFKVGNTIGSSAELQTSIPTIMLINVNPNAGMNITNTNFDVTDGVYRAGLKNYYMLSAGNAKTTNYQPQDVTMLVFALASVMEHISFMQRILGTPYIFNIRNRDLPKTLLTAQGINYDDLVKNMANYRIRFNTILQMFNKVPVPSNVKAFMKSSSMYSNYYTDDTSPMAQFYVMKPDKLWIFNEDTEPSILQPFGATNPVGSTTLFSDLLMRLESQINALLTSATFNYIFADILRLADKGSMHLMQYGLIPDGYVAPILYSEEFNLWVDNAILLRDPDGSTTDHSTGGNIVYDDIDHNSLKYSPRFKYLESVELSEYVLNFNTNNPSIEDKVAATRLVAAYLHSETGYAKAVCGTHYITSVDVLDGEDYVHLPEFNLQGYNTQTTPAGFATILRKFDVLSKFKHAPHIHVYDWDATDAAQMVYNSSNYDYYTTVDYNYLWRMFDAEWLTYLTIE